MICFSEKKAVPVTGTLFWVLVCLVAVLAAGCGKAPSPARSDTQDFPGSRFLTAEASGRSDMDARQQAMAQLSSIFQAKVSSDFSSRTHSYLTQDQAEAFETDMAARIHVVSGVVLEGARIGRAWKDEKTGQFHALAVLDRMDAGENWSSETDVLDARIRAEQAAGKTVTGPLSRMAVLNRIIALVLERQILESRLRVVDFPVMAVTDLDLDLAGVMAERSTLLSGLKVFISITGEHGDQAEDILAQALTGKGIFLATDPGQANARVLGEVEITDLNLDHPSARFVRARGNVLVFETHPQTLFVQINDKIRKGHQDLEEARFRAVEALGKSLAGQLIKALGY